MNKITVTVGLVLAFAWSGYVAAEPGSKRNRAHAYEQTEKYAGYPEAVRQELSAIDEERRELEKLDEIDFHRVAYKYAFDRVTEGGLDLSRDQAITWADELCERPARERSLVLLVHKKAFKYAFDRIPDGGMDMNRADAMAWADKISRNSKSGTETIYVHRLAFKYAFDRLPEGLDLNREQAMAFADRICRSKDAVRTLNLHQKAFKYAFVRVSDGGLDLSKEAALEYANKKAKLEP